MARPSLFDSSTLPEVPPLHGDVDLAVDVVLERGDNGLLVLPLHIREA